MIMSTSTPYFRDRSSSSTGLVDPPALNGLSGGGSLLTQSRPTNPLSLEARIDPNRTNFQGNWENEPQLVYLCQISSPIGRVKSSGLGSTPKSESKEPNTEIDKVEARSELFFAGLAQLDRRGNVDAALDYLYDQVDAAFKEGRFSDIDELLKIVPVENYSADLLLGFLTATLPARSRLRARGEFFKRAETIIRERGEWVSGLLVGLEQLSSPPGN